MVKKYPYLVLLLFFQMANVFSQNNEGIKWLDENFSLTSKEKAKYKREIIIISKHQGQPIYKVKEYYLSGQLMATVTYKGPGFLIKIGNSKTYYENGQQKAELNYVEGAISGAYKYWYENGQLKEEGVYINQNLKEPNIFDKQVNSYFSQNGDTMVFQGNGFLKEIAEEKLLSSGPIKAGLKDGKWFGYDSIVDVSFTELYENGVLVNGTSMDMIGNEFAYQKVMISSEPVIGETLYRQCIGDYLSQKYPKSAKRKGIEGIVYVQVKVSSAGMIYQTKVIVGLEPKCNAVALESVLNCKTEHKPAIQRGVNAKSTYIVPIRFVLDK